MLKTTNSIFNTATFVGVLPVANGGTGLSSLTSGYIPYGNGTGAYSSSSNWTFDGSNAKESGYYLVSQKDVGNAPNQVPLNQYLGPLAYQTFIPYNGVGSSAPTIASATTIAPTTPIIFVSGTTAIATITPPPTLVGGGQLIIIPTGIFTTTTAGNIALASTAVVSKALIMVYDATTAKWYPSY